MLGLTNREVLGIISLVRQVECDSMTGWKAPYLSGMTQSKRWG